MAEWDEQGNKVHAIGNDIRQNGLLWALNATVLHPQGFELVLIEGALHLKGDGSTVRSYVDVDPYAVDQAWRRFRQTLLDAQTKNKTRGPNQVPSRSPGFVDPFKRTKDVPAPPRSADDNK